MSECDRRTFYAGHNGAPPAGTHRNYPGPTGLSDTVTRRMSEDRVRRGCRAEGVRHLRHFAVAGMAAAILAVAATSASAVSGGSGFNSGSGHTATRHTTGHRAQSNPFASRGMWIWYVSASNGGNLSSIVGMSRRYGLSTLMIKAGDGTGVWSQFNSRLVSSLHANGLRVCAWQYVYGNHPLGEAQVGADAVRNGADCLLIDAEAEYEGKYVQAQQYITQLRRLIGSGFPYSVFLGPGGAQYNVPQMYWVDIGTSVDRVYAHTFPLNRLYRRQIDPLGQVYNHPPSSQVMRFRQLSRSYGAPGVSWWDWQEATFGAWQAISRPVGTVTRFTPNRSLATVRRGWQGDVVVWAQEHLVSAGYRIRIDGGFGPQTASAVRGFQAAHGLTPDGVIGTSTWQTLLRYAPARVTWTASGARTARMATTRRGAGAARASPSCDR